MQIRKRYSDFLEWGNDFFSKFSVQGVCLFLYKLLVDLIYLFYIGPTFNYGIKVNALNIISSYLYMGIYIIFIYCFIKNIAASTFIFIITSMIYLIPITTYCSLGSGSSGLLFWTILYWTIFSTLQITVPVIAFKKTDLSDRVRSFFMHFLLIGTSIFTIYLSWKYTDFRVITNLLEVYDIRAEAADYNISTAFRYLQNFSTILIPMLMIFSFRQKKYVLVLWELFLLILNFSFAGHKTVLFMGVLVLVGALLWRKEMVSFILPGGIGLAMLGIIEEKIFTHAYIISFFFRRQGYVLAQLSDEYYRYFGSNPTDLFRGTFLGKIGFGNPYNLSASYVIGNNYSTQIVRCNNGFLADVWSNLGVIGIVIMPFVLIVCFRLFDMAVEGIETRYIIGLAAYYAVVFSNSTWSTVLLTHGFLIMCVGFFMFPRNQNTTGGGR